MHPRTLKTLSEYLTPNLDIGLPEWSGRFVDYSREPSYDTEWNGPYDPEYMPFFKEIMDNLEDITVREMVIRKCSRAGATETILNGLRRVVAENPVAVMYVGAQEETTKMFFNQRIVTGLKPVEACARKLRAAKVAWPSIQFEDMMLNCSWYSSRSGVKQTGYGWVILDEFSTARKFKGDAFKKRIDNYRLGQITYVSSLDFETDIDGESDALNVEFLDGDQRYWFVPDPGKAGEMFLLEMGIGANKAEFGIRFDESARRDDGSLHLQTVADTAYYLLPSGQKVTQDNKKAWIDSGEWRPTNAENASPSKRSYQINSLMLPFRNGDLGHLAVNWIKAEKQGNHTKKIWIYENDPQVWREVRKTGQMHLDVFRIQQANIFPRGIIPTAEPVFVILFVDIQAKDTVWAVWALGQKDQWMIDNGRASVLEDIPEIAAGTYTDQSGKEYRCHATFLDTGHRTTEAYRFGRDNPRVVLLKGDSGSTTKMAKPVTYQPIDSFPSGKRIGRGRTLQLVHLHPTIFRDQYWESLTDKRETDRAEWQSLESEYGKINIHFHREITRVDADSLTGEYPELTQDKWGQSKVVWSKVTEKRHEDDLLKNDLFDLAYYAFAARWMMRSDIARLSRKGKQAEPEKKAAAKPAKEKPARPKSSGWDDWDDDD